MATRVVETDTAQPRLIYRAEAYDDSEGVDVPFWSCEHEHGNPVEAHECGTAFLRRAAQRRQR